MSRIRQTSNDAQKTIKYSANGCPTPHWKVPSPQQTINHHCYSPAYPSVRYTLPYPLYTTLYTNNLPRIYSVHLPVNPVEGYLLVPTHPNKRHSSSVVADHQHITFPQPPLPPPQCSPPQHRAFCSARHSDKLALPLAGAMPLDTANTTTSPPDGFSGKRYVLQPVLSVVVGPVLGTTIQIAVFHVRREAGADRNAIVASAPWTEASEGGMGGHVVLWLFELNAVCWCHALLQARHKVRSSLHLTISLSLTLFCSPVNL